MPYPSPISEIGLGESLSLSGHRSANLWMTLNAATNESETRVTVVSL
jgi:hypothetical protein